MAPSLLGPPALRGEQPKKSSSTPSSSSGDPFMDLMVNNFNNTKLPNPVMGFTEKGAPTYMTSGNPCVDFFHHIVPNSPSYSIEEKLGSAWSYNDLTTLKLICHLRGVRGTGKSDKQGFYTAALWLHKHHPKTLACNVKWIAAFGYFKDLPEILYRLLEGAEVRKASIEEAKMRKLRRAPKKFLKNKKGKRFYKREVKVKNPKAKSSRSRIPQEKRIEIEMKRAKIEKEKAKDLRKEKELVQARKAYERYSRDPDFRFLHDQISQVFADHLVADMQLLKSGETGKISLAAKWCPSLDSAYDKAILLCESIARRVFPRDSHPEYEAVEDAHYAYRVRDRLRKEVLVPLRQTLELPEIFMSSNQWDSLPYNRVPSVAMTNYKKHFLKHDETRFNEFLGKVERGEAKIAAGALFPHAIIKSLNDGEQDGGQVAELQWKRMVDDLSAKGKLKNCIAVCDVSGSMSGEPMEVCVALGLLLSELSEHPWGGKVITFSDNPQLLKVEGDDLRTKTGFIRRMDWGGTTNFQKVFDMILEVAVAGKLSSENMIKKIFVFSDMEFDQARGQYGGYGFNYGYGGGRVQRGDNWDTNYEVIKKRFEKHGYPVPEMVFWNLRHSMATPVESNKKGVALVGGYSKNLMTLFLDDQEIVAEGPEAVMEQALSGPEYKELVVLD
ncbi:hypothetical protein ACHQM5_016009 [Ranunculus cassubicifolius]